MTNSNGNGHQDHEHVDLDLEVSIGMELEDDVTLAVDLMRMRGALVSVIPMLEGGLLDLAAGSTADDDFKLAIGTYTVAGRMALESWREAIDEWLVDHEMPLVSLYAVESSNLAAMGWAGDPDTPPFAVVEFQNGGLYLYSGVTEEVFQEWWLSDSVGAYLAQRIKGQYEYVRLVP